MAMAFEGFDPQAVKFLAQLERHNERAWFQANKGRYEQFIRQPALEFIQAIGRRMETFAPHVLADPSPTGGSLMRIYRDTRFSDDKQPYKTNVGIQFRHERSDDVHAPSFYLHVDAKEFFICCGIWKPAGADLAAIRGRMLELPDAWLAARDDRRFVRTWGEVTGDRLKRAPRGVEAAHPLAEDLKLKDFLGVLDLDRSLLHSPRLVDQSARAFQAAHSLMKFLCDALGLPY